MRQVVQDLKSGRIDVLEVPVPAAERGSVVIRTRLSLVSSGTERMLLDFGRANWLEKARQQPDKVRQVFDKVRTDGPGAALAAVSRKLEQPVALGYSNVGEIVEVGPGVTGLSVGDRVVSNGPHAGYVRVPRNLCARVPDGVTDESAVFAVVGAIALQGMRLAEPTLGECFAVSGLGLVGLLAVQLLRANGCRVLGLDFDSQRLALARELGAEVVDLGRGEDPVRAAENLTRDVGVDGVLICAATTSSDPVRIAARMCRKRGRIILVGVTGLELSRDDFFRKELLFQVSCSYGPGRYEPAYEELGHDYPPGFVRWTEQRNFEAVLDAMASGRLQTRPLVTHRFPVEQAPRAYEALLSGQALAILFEYGIASELPISQTPVVELQASRAPADSAVVVGAIGAGNWGGAVLLPELRRTGARLKTLASARGLSATHYARKLAFERSSTRSESVIDDPEINAVVIATRHDTHAALVKAGLAAGKHVYVEKPLAITLQEIAELEGLYGNLTYRPVLMVGFNRRFAPLVVQLKRALAAQRGPKAFVYIVSAGAVPADHWSRGSEGGGRIVGEACHFIDLLRFLADARIVEAQAAYAGQTGGEAPQEDIASISLRFSDGSIGTVHYLANGGRRVPKERLEVFCGGAMLRLNNFLRLESFAWPGTRTIWLWRQDKGTRACVDAFVSAVRSGAQSPIPADQIFEVARVTCSVADRLRAGADGR